MNQNHHGLYDFIGNSASPHPVLDLNGFTPGYLHPHLQTGPLQVHPGTGILPINEIPLFAGFDLPTEADFSTPAGSRPNKPRRRRTADGDVIKHRRTRNGCYTCRGRRIKCDEGRPICERCKKGSRDCVYPDAPPPKSKSKAPKGSPESPKSPKSLESPIGDEMNVDGDDVDESVTSGDALYETEATQILKEDTPASTVSHIPNKLKERQSSTAVSNKSTAADADLQKPRKRRGSVKKVNFDSGAAIYGSPESLPSAGLFPDKASDHGSPVTSPIPEDEIYSYSQLRPELRDLMRYHHVHIGFHHYFFRQDATQFVKDLLPSAALGYEPLLYAVCGFAAYHRAVAQDGKIEDFLGYYHKAVTLLLKSLKSGQEHTEGTLMTVLQLATFEEYLGDWVNLVGHLTAAKELLLEFYSPESIIATETCRKIFSWYARFEIFAGIAAGRHSTLDRKWPDAIERWHYEARAMDPSSVDLQVRWLVAYKRILSIALTDLTSKAVAGEIGKEDFALQYHDLMRQEAAWGQHLVPLTTEADPTEPLPNLRTINPNETDGNNEKGWPEDLARAPFFYTGHSWNVNLMYLDFYSTCALQRFSYAGIMDLAEVALEADTVLKEECRQVEALLNSAATPEGGILCVHSMLALLAMFLREPEYKEWCRRKLADLEDIGYFFPPAFRARIADTWGDPTVRKSWASDSAGTRPIIKSLRAFNKEREAQPRDQQGQDVKDLRGLFNSLNFDGTAVDHEQVAAVKVKKEILDDPQEQVTQTLETDMSTTRRADADSDSGPTPSTNTLPTG